MKYINILKKNKLDDYDFSVSMFLLTIILILIKVCVLYISYKNLFPLKHCVEYFISDIYFLVTIEFFVTINFSVKNKFIKWINNSLILFFVILFYIDIFTIYFFQSHEPILSIVGVIIYGGVGFTGFTSLAILWTFTLIIIYLIVIYFYISVLKSKINNCFTPIIFTISFIGCIILYFVQSFMMNIPISDTRNILSINIQTFKEFNDIDILFRDFNYDKYLVNEGGLGKNYNYDKYLINEGGLGKDFNVILVFAESLSAIDSANAGGNDNIPNFDKIQKDGITFTNFISNGRNSKESHISLFQGLPTLGLHSFNPKIDCLAKYLNNLGYNTIYVSTAYLDFLYERSQLKECGFKKVVGEEAFQNKMHYVEGTASDKDLYDYILHEIQAQTGKYFISLSTMSFHVPYNCPYGNTQELCLKYVDETLYEFYTSLQKIGFFESGILIIVGDHRKREPAERGEFNLFGPIREYKSAATIVGSGIDVGGVNDNIIQHTDFYYSIKKLLGHGNISVNKFYNDTFSASTNRNWGIVDNYYTTYNGDEYDKQIINTAKQKNPDIYDYYLSIKEVWLENSLFNKLRKNI